MAAILHVYIRIIYKGTSRVHYTRDNIISYRNQKPRFTVELLASAPADFVVSGMRGGPFNGIRFCTFETNIKRNFDLYTVHIGYNNVYHIIYTNRKVPTVFHDYYENNDMIQQKVISKVVNLNIIFILSSCMQPKLLLPAQLSTIVSFRFNNIAVV